LSVDGLADSTVTLGVVVIVWGLVGVALAFVLNEAREARNGVQRLELLQKEIEGKVNGLALSIDHTKELMQAKYQAPSPNSTGANTAIIPTSTNAEVRRGSP
jgi:hypothetical protein